MIFIIEIILHLSTGGKAVRRAAIEPGSITFLPIETSKTNLPAYDQAFSFLFQNVLYYCAR